MTICIASICNIGKPDEVLSPAIVYCADRLLSSGIGISFEQGNAKIKLIKDRAIIMDAGDASNSDIILNKQKEFDEVAKSGVRAIAESVYKEIIKLRNEKINHLLSKFNLNQDDFIEKSKNMPEALYLRLFNEIDDVDLDLKFIVAGLDNDGSPQLYTVSDERGIDCFNTVGFVAIGSGMPLSLLQITKSLHNNFIHITEALVRVYSAKKNAERTTGVGRLTDLGFLHLLGGSPDDFKAGLVEIPDDYYEKIDEMLDKIEDKEKEVHNDLKILLKEELFPQLDSPKEKVRFKKKPI